MNEHPNEARELQWEILIKAHQSNVASKLNIENSS